MAFDKKLPIEIWSRIASFLAFDDRIRLELVSPQLKESAKASWLSVRKVDIDERFNTDAKILCLLSRCGANLEEIVTQHNLPLQYGGKKLTELCPKLKSLVLNRSTLKLIEVPKDWEVEDRIMTIENTIDSLRQLERFEFLNNYISGDDGFGNPYYHLKGFDFQYHLRLMNQLVEASLISWSLSKLISKGLAELNRLDVLSIEVDSSDILTRCDMPNLRELSIRCFNPSYESLTESFCESFPNLRCLLLINGVPLDMTKIQMALKHLTKLNTLVLTRSIVLDEVWQPLNQPQRQEPLNIFIKSQYFHLFPSDQNAQKNIKIIPMPINQTGEVIHFLKSCNVVGFNFAAYSVMNMLERNFAAQSEWLKRRLRNN